MGTVLLRSNDFLKTRFPPETLRSHPPSKTGRKSDPKPTRSGRRKSARPLGFAVKENGNHEYRCRSAAKIPITGMVSILKRGETLKLTKDEKKVKFDDDEDLVLCSTGRLGPEPEMVPKQIRLTDAGVYAGSAIFSSPSPSSLPFPAFFTRNDGTSKNEEATKDLRRLLRIDLP